MQTLGTFAGLFVFWLLVPPIVVMYLRIAHKYELITFSVLAILAWPIKIIVGISIVTQLISWFIIMCCRVIVTGKPDTHRSA